MRHVLHAEGFGLRLRPVRLEDAAFIVWLRNQDYVKGKVGDSAPDVASQQQWLEAYFQREDDFYFLLETATGTPLGTNGLYGLSGDTAEWGRFIIRPTVSAALPCCLLTYGLAFRELKLRELLARCVSTNLTVHSLCRKLGFRQGGTKAADQIIGGESVDMVHFTLNAGNWSRARERVLPLAQFAEAKIKEWEERALEYKINH
ncbi:MAG: GNAT family N-acetyltransferase [Verrucomicrobiota bacterium]|jgi:RimJ/RimL family protein N-acetyltransferase